MKQIKMTLSAIILIALVCGLMAFERSGLFAAAAVFCAPSGQSGTACVPANRVNFAFVGTGGSVSDPCPGTDVPYRRDPTTCDCQELAATTLNGFCPTTVGN